MTKMNRNYFIATLYEALLKLGKVRHKRDFSRFYLGRNGGYLTMVLTGENRQASIGAINYLVRRLDHDISYEGNLSIKRRLKACLNLADSELRQRLSELARSRKAPVTF